MTTLPTEMLISGMILYDAEKAMPAVIDAGIEPSWYNEPTDRMIFEAARQLYGAGNPVNVLTVPDYISANIRPLTATESQHIIDAMDAAPVAAHAAFYLTRFDNERKARQFAEIAERIGKSAVSTGPDEVDDAINNAIGAISAINAGGGRSKETFAECAARVIRQWNSPDGHARIEWPIAKVQQSLGGLTKELVYIAARESVGKTAFVLNWLIYNAKAGRKGAMASLESPMDLISPRALSILSNVDSLAYRHRWPECGHAQRLAYEAAVQTLAALPITVTDTPMDGGRLRAWAQSAVANGAEWLVVDNMRHIRMPRMEKTNDQYAAKSMLLKEIRDDVQVPVIALHHLSKSMDVAWADEIRRDVDILLFLVHNEELSIKPTPGQYGSGRYVVDLQVHKGRDTIKDVTFGLLFNKPTQVFSDYTGTETRRVTVHTEDEDEGK